MTTMYAAVPLADMLTAPDGALGMRHDDDTDSGHRVVRLSAVGAVAYSASRPGTTLAGLTATLVRQFGPPPEQSPPEATEAVVAALMGEGLLVVSNSARSPQASRRQPQ